MIEVAKDFAKIMYFNLPIHFCTKEKKTIASSQLALGLWEMVVFMESAEQNNILQVLYILHQVLSYMYVYISPIAFCQRNTPIQGGYKS